MLSISTPDVEGILQVSKSRKLPLLIDHEEMESLWEYLGDVSLFSVGKPLAIEEAIISKENFLKTYKNYIDGIKKGNLIDEAILQPYVSSVLTKTKDALYAQALSNGKYLVKAKLPVIQLQRHHFIVSDTIHSGVMGKESITWGLQFSYPQMFLDPKTKQIGKVEKSDQFPNTELFHRLAKWVRNYTSPTPFIMQGKKINHPMRIGKKCFDWIHNHPQLQGKTFYVENRKHSQVLHRK